MDQVYFFVQEFIASCIHVWQIILFLCCGIFQWDFEAVRYKFFGVGTALNILTPMKTLLFVTIVNSTGNDNYYQL
jgi:hypothetical protein